MCSANGAPTPGLLAQLANNAVLGVALRNAQALGRIQQLQNFGANPVHSHRATCDPFILTTFLPFNIVARASTDAFGEGLPE